MATKTIRIDLEMGERMNLPTLYKKTSTGAIQMWKISVFENPEHSSAYDIQTTHGQLEGKLQITHDTIFEGKNIGKKNETTILQQAEAEATSKWEKQKKKGYVESIDAAQNEELDGLVEGGILPMLAHKFSEQGHKIKYPCYVQPKLDGIRCIAILENGTCTLWSRTRKKITSCPHIIDEIQIRFGKSSERLVFDGELYNHEFKSNFEHIVHLVRQEEPDYQHKDVEYHIYDIIKPVSFEDRAKVLKILSREPFFYLKFVLTESVSNESEVMGFFDTYKKMGYEGAMLRNGDSKYVNKRSYDLQKVKEFDDGEFKIIGIEEGRGKLAGHVGSFICQTSDEKEFLAKMSGDTEKLREYFTNHSLWVGKKLTVQYQGLTGAKGVPRFPVGIIVRDYE